MSKMTTQRDMCCAVLCKEVSVSFGGLLMRLKRTRRFCASSPSTTACTFSWSASTCTADRTLASHSHTDHTCDLHIFPYTSPLSLPLPIHLIFMASIFQSSFTYFQFLFTSSTFTPNFSYHSELVQKSRRYMHLRQLYPLEISCTNLSTSCPALFIFKLTQNPLQLPIANKGFKLAIKYITNLSSLSTRMVSGRSPNKGF